MDNTLKKETSRTSFYLKAKKMGYLDRTVESFSGEKVKNPIYASYKMVDTCAAEFGAETPYFYSTFDDENEAAEFIEQKNSGKKKIIVFRFGSYQNRSGN
ncbi:MAG: hypothetical protein L6V93_02715 [Clostridiales bacterium]|nr:MAG: hypothetical protein L6V93_02715 [Clostridiales bacterium]